MRSPRKSSTHTSLIIPFALIIRNTFLSLLSALSWRVLAYANRKRGLSHFRGRHEKAVRETLATWRDYLLGNVDDIGRPEIHLLPFCGVVDHRASDVPENTNRYLGRAIEIDIGVSETEAFTFCKLGPLLLIGLIEYPDLSHWQNTKILKNGRLAHGEFCAPAQYLEFIFKRCRRSAELEAKLSGKQIAKIDHSYREDIGRVMHSGTYKTACLDVDLAARIPFEPEK